MDLGDTLVLIPTSGAGRAIRRELSKTAVLSPDFRLPMGALQPDGLSIASRLEREAAWVLLLDREKRDSFRALVPDAVSLDSPEDKFGVAARLCNVCDQLAEAAMDPSIPDVQERLDEDSIRWQVLGKLYRQYLEVLSLHGLRDPNDVALAQAANPAIPPRLKRVVVACIPDLPVVVRKYLEALAGESIDVDVLAWSPSGQAAHLDPWGRPEVAWWKENLPDVAGECIIPANDTSTEAGLLLDYAAARREAGYALFSASEESSLALAQEIAWRGAEAHLPEGCGLAQSEPATILLVWDAFMRSRRLRDLRVLLQKPSFLSFFAAAAGKPGHFGPDEALDACDRLIGERLCSDLEAASSWLAHADKPSRKDALRVHLAQEALVRTAAGLAAHKMSGLEMLEAVSRNCGAVEAGSLAAKEIAAIAEVTGQIAGSSLLSSLEVGMREAAVRADIARKRVFPRAADDAVAVQGWLEAPWTGAAAMVVAGCREGALPGGVHEDSFLPDGARARIGLATQDTRFARDAYLLSCLVAARPLDRLRLGYARFRNQGEPNRPSRLLFGCNDDELPRRSALLFELSAPSRRKNRTKREFKLHIPAPESSQWPVEAIRVTAFKSFLECPLRFYLGNVLGLRKVDPDAREIPATDFGTVIHKVLEECAGDPAYRVATDAEEIGRMLSLRLDHVAPRYFGDKPSPVVRVQLESMRVRLLAAADTEARIHAEGWQILAVEHKVRKEDKRMLGGLAVAGTMDRVERHPVHGLRILDYKTYARAKNPRKTHIGPQRGRKHLPEADFEMMTEKGKLVPRSWTDLQLPLYVWLARQIWPEDAAKGVRVGYFLLPPETDAGKDSLEIFALDDAMEKSAIRCAARVAELVKDGRFWPPSPAAWVEFDDFAGWFADADPALLIDKESAERLNGNP